MVLGVWIAGMVFYRLLKLLHLILIDLLFLPFIFLHISSFTYLFVVLFLLRRLGGFIYISWFFFPPFGKIMSFPVILLILPTNKIKRSFISNPFRRSGEKTQRNWANCDILCYIVRVKFLQLASENKKTIPPLKSRFL